MTPPVSVSSIYNGTAPSAPPPALGAAGTGAPTPPVVINAPAPSGQSVGVQGTGSQGAGSPAAGQGAASPVNNTQGALPSGAITIQKGSSVPQGYTGPWNADSCMDLSQQKFSVGIHPDWRHHVSSGPVEPSQIYQQVQSGVVVGVGVDPNGNQLGSVNLNQLRYDAATGNTVSPDCYTALGLGSKDSPSTSQQNASMKTGGIALTQWDLNVVALTHAMTEYFKAKTSSALETLTVPQAMSKLGPFLPWPLVNVTGEIDAPTLEAIGKFAGSSYGPGAQYYQGGLDGPNSRALETARDRNINANGTALGNQYYSTAMQLQHAGELYLGTDPWTDYYTTQGKQAPSAQLLKSEGKLQL